MMNIIAIAGLLFGASVVYFIVGKVIKEAKMREDSSGGDRYVEPAITDPLERCDQCNGNLPPWKDKWHQFSDGLSLSYPNWYAVRKCPTCGKEEVTKARTPVPSRKGLWHE